MSYNGYPTQDAFHAALAERHAAYAERMAALTPEQKAHAGCDHAYGICNEPAAVVRR